MFAVVSVTPKRVLFYTILIPICPRPSPVPTTQPYEKSDNISAPLCLFPARRSDLSLVTAATIPPPPETTSRINNGYGSKDHGRTNSHEQKRHSRWSFSARASDHVIKDDGDVHGGGGGGGGGCGLADDADGTGDELGAGVGGDVGRLWPAEDGGYLCVDILLERTLEELGEGLAFAAR